MQLTVLGCRSGMPAAGSPSSGYLVETGRTRLLLDCGPGIATALSASAGPLDGVVITHLHLDHCHDLLPLGKSLLRPLLRFPGAPEPGGEFERVPLLVPAGAKELFERWALLFPISSMPVLNRAFEVAFDVREYEPGERFELGDCVIELHGLVHASPNCGIRVSHGDRTLAYTGDTGMTDALVKLAANADVLLSEATLREADQTDHGHLSAAEAGRVAAAAGAGELVLTHFVSTDPAWLHGLLTEATAEFDGPVRLAEPGMRI
ncbi:MBL fold metallo-hydrolase [Amycolatopsis endophytica]|uniref:Ribonuclease BN (tRNA processing enzyme) n=1 Tax=Amycolatopsis endophytica TaxID=860233 RepID=A0A853B933_9PSEU|nr:MBL fold metallo-hydrolase [Amycolatopsis endophytica]NYI91305.1 ribonuclease BN (tRNA processing enzyme) [Amycolatopsis endophytica]